MNSVSANLNVMIKACEKASKVLIRDFGELEKLQASKKGPIKAKKKIRFEIICIKSTILKSKNIIDMAESG